MVAVTNLIRVDEPTGRRWEAHQLVVTNDLLESFRFSAPLETGARRVLIAESGVWTNVAVF